MSLLGGTLYTSAIVGCVSLLSHANAAERTNFPAPSCGETPPLSSYAMTYDPSRRQVVVFGGESSDRRPSGELWGWDGRAWSCLTPSTNGTPASRGAAVIAFDERRGVLVLYGGRIGRRGLRDTWELSSTGWSLRDTAGPTTAPHGSMAYDSSAGAILLYHSAGDGGALRESWRWDGRGWTSVASGPNAQFPNAMLASDARHPATLVTARQLGAADAFEPLFYEWRGGGWALMSTTGDVPHFSPQAPVARTPTGALLYAGFEPDTSVRTWTLGGAVWRRYDGPSPSRRRGVQMVFDPSRRVVVMQGGDTGSRLLDETWEWNGARWTRVRGG